MLNNSNANFNLSGDLFDDDSMENSKNSSTEGKESVIDLFGDSEQTSAKKKRKRRRKKKSTTDSNTLSENNEDNENNESIVPDLSDTSDEIKNENNIFQDKENATTKNNGKTNLLPEELLFSDATSGVESDVPENSNELKFESSHDDEINSLFENDNENDNIEITDTINTSSDDTSPNIFKGEETGKTRPDDSAESDNSVSVIETSDDTNLDNDDLDSFFDKDINSSNSNTEKSQKLQVTQETISLENDFKNNTNVISNDMSGKESESEDDFFATEIQSSIHTSSKSQDDSKESSSFEGVDSTVQDDTLNNYLDSLFDDLLDNELNDNDTEEVSEHESLIGESENSSGSIQNEQSTFDEDLEKSDDEEEISIIPDNTINQSNSTNDSFDFDDNLEDNSDEDNTSNYLEQNDLSDLDALADEKDDFDLIVDDDNDDNNDNDNDDLADLDNLLFDGENENETEVETKPPVEEKSDVLSLNENKSDKEKEFASMIGLIDDDFSISDESNEFDNSIEATVEAPVETESVIPQPLQEENDDNDFDLSEETYDSQENQEAQINLEEPKESEKSDNNGFELENEGLEESEPIMPVAESVVPDPVAVKPIITSSNLIANRYRFVSSVCSNDLYSNYIAKDSVTGEDVDVLEIHNPDYFDFVIEKAKKLNKLNGNPNIPYIKRAFKNNNKVYVIKNVYDCSSFETFVCSTEPNWANISVMILELVKTIVKLRRIGFNFSINSQNIFFSNNSLLLKNIFEAELELADEYVVRHDDVFDVCSLIYYYITSIPFNSEDVRPLEQFISINEKDSDLILRGLGVIPNSKKLTLVNFYNEMSSETAKLYDTSMFKISEFSMNSPKKMLRNERNFNKKQKKEKKKRVRKYKRKIRIISTILAFIVLSIAALFGVYKIAPDLFKQVFPSICHFVSPSDVSKSDEPNLYVYSDTSVDNEDTVSVPDLVGKNFDWVSDSVKYENFDIRCIREEYSDTIEKGDIISQSIEEDKKVKKATPIGVVVSLGSLRDAIPSLTGKTVEEAQYLLEGIGLYIGNQTEEYNTDIPAGCIISMVEPDGELVTGSFIDVIVSLGANTSDSTTASIETQSTTNATSSSAKKVVRSTMTTTNKTTSTVTSTTSTASTTKSNKNENSGGIIVNFSDDEVYVDLG